MKSNQIEKFIENEVSPTKYRSKPITSIFNKISNPSKTLSGELVRERLPAKMSSNKTNPYSLKCVKDNPIFQTTVDDKEITKFSSNGKIPNIDSSLSIAHASSNKNKVSVGKYSHVFGDIDDKLNKFDTTRSITSTRLVKFESNKEILKVDVLAANTDVEDTNSPIPSKSRKRNISMFAPFSNLIII